MKNIELYIAIGFLLLVNAFVLYKYNDVTNEAQEILNETKLDYYIASTFKNSNRAILFGDSILNELKYQADESQLKLVFLFQGSDCTNCIVETLDMLNRFKNQNILNENSITYYFNQNNGAGLENLISRNNLNLNSDEVIKANLSDILKTIDIDITPLLLVLNNEEIIDSYQPEPGNLVTRDAFGIRLKYILTKTSN